MSLQLPESYTATTKNDAVIAVLKALEEEVAARKAAASLKDDEGYYSSLQKSYYYAGVGCALTIVSTTNLAHEFVEQLNNKTYGIIKLQYGVRARILGVKPFDDQGAPVEAVKVPNLGKKISSADLAGWESVESRQILVKTILDQIEIDLELLKNIKKIVDSGKAINKQNLADVSVVVFLDSFLFGFLDGIKYTRGTEDFETIPEVVRPNNQRLSVIDCISALERESKQIDPARTLARAIAIRSGGKVAPPVVPKPVEPKPVAPAPIIPTVEPLALARYLRVSL